MKRPTKRLIIEAGINLFSKFGYKATTMEDLSGAVGIRPSALFKHFPAGKLEIFTAVIQSLAEQAIEADSVRDMTPEKYYRANPEALKLLMLTAIADGKDFQLVTDYFLKPVSTATRFIHFFELAAELVRADVSWRLDVRGAA